MTDKEIHTKAGVWNLIGRLGFEESFKRLNNKTHNQMTSRDFAFWLQGFFEVANPKELTAEQTDMIKRHLALVFKHEIDPSMPDPTGELQNIHDGPSPTTVTLPKPDNQIYYRC